MVRANVNDILNAAQSLSDGERKELRQLLDDRAARKSELTEQEQVRRQLVADGVLSHTPPTGKDVERFRRWQPISIKGKPLSETIIEERR